MTFYWTSNILVYMYHFRWTIKQRYDVSRSIIPFQESNLGALLSLAQGPTVRKWALTLCLAFVEGLDEWARQWGNEEGRVSQLSHSEAPRVGDKMWMQITRIQSKQWSHQCFGSNPLCPLLFEMPGSFQFLPTYKQGARSCGGGSLLGLMH